MPKQSTLSSPAESLDQIMWRTHSTEVQHRLWSMDSELLKEQDSLSWQWHCQWHAAVTWCPVSIIVVFHWPTATNIASMPPGLLILSLTEVSSICKGSSSIKQVRTTSVPTSILTWLFSWTVRMYRRLYPQWAQKRNRVFPALFCLESWCSISWSEQTQGCPVMELHYTRQDFPDLSRPLDLRLRLIITYKKVSRLFSSITQ